jgi:hypothetical protein
LANWIKKEPTICCLRRPISLTEKKTQAEDERLEEDLPSQWSPKTGRNSNTYLRQSRLQTYVDEMK